MKQKKSQQNTLWLCAAIVLAAITIFFYIISDAYLSAYSTNEEALVFYATIDTWMAIFAVVACAISTAKSKGWGRIVSTLLFLVCSLLGFSATLMVGLSQMTF